tara:strand:+ start:88 stop:267 length:180 start_codon:yes stop_codon:yes gene_type:complete
MGMALKNIGTGDRVTEAQFAQGFESASGFRDAAQRLFGAPPKSAAPTRAYSSPSASRPR